MNNITKNRLIDSGWKEQRKINTDLIRKKYDEIGLEYPEVVDKFLKEYGIKQEWLAEQVGISISSFKKFKSKTQTLSKSDCYNLCSFMKQYKLNMKWLGLV